MLPKKRFIESKTTTNSSIKKPNVGKSISLIINTNHFSNTSISKNFYPNIPKKSNSVEKTSQKNLKSNKNNKNKNSSIYNITLHRQNSQGSLYSLKTYINDTQLTNNNIKYHKLNSNHLSEAKTPKLLELLNNKIKKKKNYLDTYNNSLSKGNNYNKSKTSLSLVHKKKNLTQGNIDYINLEDYYNYGIFKSTRNQKILNKIAKENNQDNYRNKTNKNKHNRYDRNKCIIERKIYGGEKQPKKSDREKNGENKTLPNNCEYLYNKMIFNNIKLNLNKEININNINKIEKNETNSSKNYYKINLNNESNNKHSSNNNKFLIKSKTNNILNTSLEDLTQSNKIEKLDTTNNGNGGGSKDIKLIFPSFINKADLINESSQESTNQVGNTNSNKITINNTNLGYRKEKFISSFIDGPEDIHCKFVELHRQRKMFYENLCNKLEEDINSIDNNRSSIYNDFDKSEYSEYFDNYNENVPII